ncbi:MAG: hypothetical protein WCS74_00945 [Dehalococcoidales bacterium]|jgi:hypothetical protein|nr:hypothetical protein [Dehalococcoidales bacterium]MDD3265179.1 hypothetical protein [Dehalococcoidales bacterium]MDD4322512.1 hypothetical protein [Dehalococcoidales bacterium]MDD4793861.1 hypothetical protein [Dehalococcoidales bacterium]MDD5121906.1 hypothetical protein [Dehalococcoidales bacterium]
MKNRVRATFVTILTIMTLFLPSVINLAAEGRANANEVALAQNAGQAFVNEMSVIGTDELVAWKDSSIILEYACYDLNECLNAYMFSIESDNNIVGHVLVGSPSYGYPIFEAGEAAPPTASSSEIVASILEKYLVVDVAAANISTPIRFYYLGVNRLYATYEVQQQMIGVNLINDSACLVSDLESWLPLPHEYKSNKQEASIYMPSAQDGAYWLSMEYYQSGSLWCGPCSGVSIGQYYRDIKNYSGLYDNATMYDRLYDLMGTWSWGPTMPPSVSNAYGNGFEAMTIECNYSNFTYNNVAHVGGGDFFSRVVPSIDNDWPVALCLYGNLWEENHWVAIRGYLYTSSDDHYIYCTDSAAHENWRAIDWDVLPNIFHDIVIVKND